jgi:signal transduction histidine kinase
MTHEPVNILLVDDQPAKLLSYAAILDDLGENILTAGSAQEALEHLLKRNVAVMLVDVRMPEVDGFELAAMVRNHPRFETTAIIFVSAVALTDLDRLKGYEHGAVDYVPVPVVPELLRAKVRIFAELYRKSKQLRQLNAELERRVAERTAELAQANAELERRVEERTREREAAMAQVHEMQKLESLGQLTGGVAHDFNNVLMAILGNLDLLRSMPNDANSRRLIDGAIRAAERGATLTKRMLAFARRQELRPEAVDVAKLINGMGEMLRRSLGPTIDIGMPFAEGLAMVRVDPNQLELAVLNLALNGRDAMPEGGRLTIGARQDNIEATGIQGLAPGEYVCIVVADGGTGMDETTLKRAAEPFFTTKGVGKGTGLGLSMVHGLAAQSGGAVRLSSRIGLGTTVELWLPVAERVEVHASVSANPEGLARVPPCQVLLVEDDAEVTTATVAMLEQLGHRVLVASSGVTALEVLERAQPVDLVITDHAMPGMTGWELANRIRASRPGLPIILATGYADVPGSTDHEVPRLDKPYRLENLSSAIATAVGARSRSDAGSQANPAAAGPADRAINYG